jgi:AraC family transcriptional regulator of adaptative response / DNA-3-methyladenine glycosylase II
VDAALATDPAMVASVTASPGLRVPGAVDGPEILIRAMLGQQVSVAGAQTAAARLTIAADERLPQADGELTHLFPSPAAIAALGPEVIAGPRRRAQAICDAAASMADGSLVVDAGRNTAELTADLVARPGIGPWTAGYVAMRLLADSDVLLTGDLVIRAGARLLGLPDRPAELVSHSATWRPYRSYAGMHLWRVALADAARRKADTTARRRRSRDAAAPEESLARESLR